MQIRNFEDLDVYKKAREFRRAVYETIKRLPKEEQFALGPQMRRAAISVTNNIAEGFGRFHFQENIQFCRHARGSLCELFDDLNICVDENYCDREQLSRIRKLGDELLVILNGYIAYLKRAKEASE